METEAAAALSPGNLLELTSANTIQKHSVAGGVAEKNIAKEDALEGRTVDTDYAVGDVVSSHLAQSGDVVLALVKAGENVAVGDQLVSAGDGTLIPVASLATGVTVEQVIAVALDAADLTATGVVDTLVSVRIL